MKNIYFFLLLIASLFVFPGPAKAALEPSTEFEATLQSLGVKKQLLCGPACGRGPAIVTPERIIMHVTQGGATTAQGEWEYFNSGSEGRAVGTHFIVGNAGDIIQGVIMGDTQVEYAQTVGGYKPHISLEMTSKRSYDSKSEMPPEQYKAAYDLVRALMQQYNIPLGNVEYDQNYPDDNGVYGHYQMAPSIKTDPGAGWLRDFRADLKAGGALTSGTGTAGGGSAFDSDCFVTAVGNPTGEKPICVPESGGNSGGGAMGPCQEAPTPPDRSLIRQAIIDKWGIELNLNEEQLGLAWEEFHEIDCTGFLQDIKGTVVGSWDSGYAQQFNCPGEGGSQVMFSNQWAGDFMKAILVHELTHVWQFCSEKGEQNRIADGSAFDEEGGVTNYARTGCGFDVSLLNEDHADTIALYLNPDQGELTCGNGAPNPFKDGKYPLHRGVAESGVGKQ